MSQAAPGLDSLALDRLQPHPQPCSFAESAKKDDFRSPDI